jgi:hypothetical protein
VKNDKTGNAFSNCDTYYYFTVTESIISAPLQENNAMAQTLSPGDMEILKKRYKTWNLLII